MYPSDIWKLKTIYHNITTFFRNYVKFSSNWYVSFLQVYVGNEKKKLNASISIFNSRAREIYNTIIHEKLRIMRYTRRTRRYINIYNYEGSFFDLFFLLLGNHVTIWNDTSRHCVISGWREIFSRWSVMSRSECNFNIFFSFWNAAICSSELFFNMKGRSWIKEGKLNNDV